MEPVVTIEQGQVRGSLRDGVASFLGIPYAASPTGVRRFRPPQPAEPWDGVRPATAIGATPPCAGYRPPFDEILYQPTVPGDDWLTVNVWTPDPAASGLPVMVWFYGGAFTNGNTAIPMYDGHPFARDGVVLVTFNYRLGVDGFALLPDAPANRGLLDQIAALEWVQQNIAAFGGDPGKVTIFGESAGAMSVTSMMVAPRAAGLFARAITQSGSVQAAADPADAALVTAVLSTQLGREASAAALADVDIDDLLAAQRAVSDALAVGPDPATFGATIVASLMAFIPVVDGDVLPSHPLEALRSGASASVPLLTGTTEEEFRFFVVPSGLAAMTTEEAVESYLSTVGAPSGTLGVYRGNRPDAPAGDVLAAIITDRFFRLPCLAAVEARPAGASWVYEFGWASAHKALGAAHAMDLPFVFDALGAEGVTGLTGPDAPQKLADAMHRAWVEFATTGDPGWLPYDGQRTVMVFDADGSHETQAPREDERAVWTASA